MDSDMSETTISATIAVEVVGSDRECPVVFFSGFDNREMMAAYNIIASQIYLEVGVTAAYAKVVPNAMGNLLIGSWKRFRGTTWMQLVKS
jgi:hypothetical protein